ncbi:hypothetical protein SLEP1_g42505 [Rubroshorea leprosula]|uniref:Translation initiation factor 1 n=1 Tax=Rubroshorea leprosula TaxID=152421 RepID=A0AAV5LA23_9ROSI|nr:hypothetical protein SLEP1_g42505 [Rubroshorea leprosula]
MQRRSNYGERVIYQTSVKERNRTVLSGYVDLRRLCFISVD